MDNTESRVKALALASSDPAHVWHELYAISQREVVEALSRTLATQHAVSLLPEVERQLTIVREKLARVQPSLPGLQETLDAARLAVDDIRQRRAKVSYTDSRQDVLEDEYKTAGRALLEAQTNFNFCSAEVKSYRDEIDRLTRLERALSTPPAPDLEVLDTLRRELRHDLSSYKRR